MLDSVKPVIPQRCKLVQAIEYLGLNWKPYDMRSEMLFGGRRKRFDAKKYLMKDRKRWTKEERIYFEGMEKGAERLYKALASYKISHFYGISVEAYKLPNINERIEVTDDYIIDEVNFFDLFLSFNKGCYLNVEFDTEDIAALLKQKLESPQHRIKRTKKLAKEFFNQGITQKNELYKAVTEQLEKDGYKEYSPRALDRYIEPLGLSLVKNPRGRPKKYSKTIA